MRNPGCNYPRFPTCGLESMDWDFSGSRIADANQDTSPPAKNSKHDTIKRSWAGVSRKDAPDSTTSNYHDKSSSSCSWKPPRPIARDSLVMTKTDDECQSDAFTDDIQWDPIKYGQRDSSEKLSPTFPNVHQHFMKSTLNVAMNLASSSSNHRHHTTSKRTTTKQQMPPVRKISPTIVLDRINSTTSTVTANSIVSSNAEASSSGFATASDCLISKLPCGKQKRLSTKCHVLRVKDSNSSDRNVRRNEGHSDQGSRKTIGVPTDGGQQNIVDTMSDFNDFPFILPERLNRTHHPSGYHCNKTKKVSRKDYSNERKDDDYPLQTDRQRESKTMLRTQQSRFSARHPKTYSDDSHAHASLHPACMINSKHYQPCMEYSIQPRCLSYQHRSRHHNSQIDSRSDRLNTQRYATSDDEIDKFKSDDKQHIPQSQSKEFGSKKLVDEPSKTNNSKAIEISVEQDLSMYFNTNGRVATQEVSTVGSSSSSSPAAPPYSKVACGRGQCRLIRWPSLRSLLVSLVAPKPRAAASQDANENSELTKCLVEKTARSND